MNLRITHHDTRRIRRLKLLYLFLPMLVIYLGRATREVVVGFGEAWSKP